MSDEIEIEVSIDKITEVAGSICVELMRQIEVEGENGSLDEDSLHDIAIVARRIAITCATGVRPE